MKAASDLLRRQVPLRAAYRERPAEALIRKRAHSAQPDMQDPVHGVVTPGEGFAVAWAYGIDRAVGGLHDAPNPGDMLCAALAACQYSSVRMVADHFGVCLQSLEVEVVGTVDVRGTLGVDRAVPVGFRSLDCSVRLRPAKGTAPEAVQAVLMHAERACVNLATLRSGVAVRTMFESGETTPEGQSEVSSQPVAT